ncbi:DUF1707 domain-containing protein [Glycomyces sp. L485]|uniref:DUF1707 SHOCT-like domain-containing protein n=1 Tax=Glycomyces sp. L485 TaxID=2909235 RepID=UPI001F4B564C|nr:DUF1707 domain-containing protein [Glycomyces sp. L485]
MSEDRGKLRISNADRNEAVAHLRRALDEGRLDLSEFDDRSRAVYESKTNAELDLVFDDLPIERGKELRPAGDTGQAESKPRGVPPSLHGLIWIGLPLTAIWAISSISAGEFTYYWPIWPVGILTAIVLAQWLTGDID